MKTKTKEENKELVTGYEDELIRIVIYPSNDELYKEHIIYLNDYEKALEISVCPKCKYYVFHKEDRGVN
jgi:hypothetical protein